MMPKDNVVSFGDKVKAKKFDIKQELAMDTVFILCGIVDNKLSLLGIETDESDSLEIADAVMNSFVQVAEELDVVKKLDEENPPHLAALKMYDIICNRAVDTILNSATTH